MTYRMATPTDKAALVALENRLFGPGDDRLSAKAVTYHLARQDRIFGCWDGDVLAGYGLILWRKEWARLYSLGVHPDFRGRGLGEGLLAYGIALCQARGVRYLQLEVRPQNSSALKLYLGHGFRPIGQLPSFYTDGGDALLLRLRF